MIKSFRDFLAEENLNEWYGQKEYAKGQSLDKVLANNKIRELSKILNDLNIDIEQSRFDDETEECKNYDDVKKFIRGHSYSPYIFIYDNGDFDVLNEGKIITKKKFKSAELCFQNARYIYMVIARKKYGKRYELGTDPLITGLSENERILQVKKSKIYKDLVNIITKISNDRHKTYIDALATKSLNDIKKLHSFVDNEKNFSLSEEVYHIASSIHNFIKGDKRIDPNMSFEDYAKDDYWLENAINTFEHIMKF